MNKEQIFQMKAGQELSQKLAEGIMGECYHQHWDGGKDSINCLKCGESRFYHQHSQAYSTDISAAWEVVERMAELKWYYFVSPLFEGESPLALVNLVGYSVGFRLGGDLATCIDIRIENIKQFPEAICKAALLSLNKEATLEVKNGTNPSSN